MRTLAEFLIPISIAGSIYPCVWLGIVTGEAKLFGMLKGLFCGLVLACIQIMCYYLIYELK